MEELEEFAYGGYDSEWGATSGRICLRGLTDVPSPRRPEIEFRLPYTRVTYFVRSER